MLKRDAENMLAASIDSALKHPRSDPNKRNAVQELPSAVQELPSASRKAPKEGLSSRPSRYRPPVSKIESGAEASGIPLPLAHGSQETVEVRFMDTSDKTAIVIFRLTRTSERGTISTAQLLPPRTSRSQEGAR